MKRRNIISILLNIGIIISGLYAILHMMLSNKSGVLVAGGIGALYYFTIDSNILLVISSILVVINLLTKRKLNDVIFTIKMIATTNVTLTFIVVVCYLGFVMGWNFMIGGENFFLHIINPILALISYLFCEYCDLPKRYTILNILPPLIYVCVIIPMVILGKNPPYPFLDVTHNSIYETIIVFLLMAIGIYFIGYIMYVLNKKINKKINKI